MHSNHSNITDLANLIAEKICIKIEKWNLYLGDAGLSRSLAIECLSNLGSMSYQEAVRKSLNALQVKIGDGKENIPLSNFISSSQVIELERILENLD